MDSYPQFGAWLESLDDQHRAEILAMKRGDDLPDWVAPSLRDHGLLVIDAHITDGTQRTVRLFTAHEEDHLESLRSNLTSTRAM